MLSAPWRNLRQRGEVVRGVLFFLLIFVVYIANIRHIEWGDTIPTRYLPLSIIREFNFDLDEFPFLYKKLIPYYLQYRDGHFVSSYPVGAAVLAVPFYLIPVLLGISSQSPWLPFLEKLSAAAIAVLSALFLYLAVRRLASEKAAVVATGVYAFGTSTFSISSQALWQHGPSQFFLTLGVYLLIRSLQQEAIIPWSGLVFASAVVCRQTNVLLMVPLFMYLAGYRRNQLLKWTLFALPPIIFLLAYNHVYFGSIFEMGYGGGVLNPASSHWETPFFAGLLGVLVSPSKGLFVYSPILLLSLLGICAVWKGQREPLLRYLSVGPILVLLLYSKWHFWWGGETYGPRLVADITPFLALYLVPVWNAVEGRKMLKSLFVVLALISLTMHAIGAYAFDASWYRKDELNSDNDRLWSWRDSPFLHYGRILGSKNISFMRTRVSGLPTSAQQPQELSGTLTLPEISESLSAAEPLALHIEMANTGHVIWLFQTNNGQGAIRFGWRWLQDDRTVPYSEGRVLLSQDIFPGEQEKLRLKIWPPSEPGRYTLVLGMVREPEMWFSEQQLSLQVIGNCDFDSVVNKPITLIPDPPGVGVNADKLVYRPGEVSRVNISLANGQFPRNLTLYIALRSPDGRLRLLTPLTEFSANPPCSLWTRIRQSNILSKGFHMSWNIGLQLEPTASGLYTLYAFLTEPDTTQVVAKASSTFLLLPSPSASIEVDGQR